MASFPEIPIVVTFDETRPVRVHGESVGVLTDELETVEAELFDARAQLFEEVRLVKTLTDEIVNVEQDFAHVERAFWNEVKAHHKTRERFQDRIDELEAKEFVASKRGNWVGVALGVAFALGGYAGLLAGVAV